MPLFGSKAIHVSPPQANRLIRDQGSETSQARQVAEVAVSVPIVDRLPVIWPFVPTYIEEESRRFQYFVKSFC